MRVRTNLALALVAGIVIGGLVFLVGRGGGDGDLPPVGEPGFGGEIGGVAGPLHVVEIGGDTDYRIVEIDPGDGGVDPVFEVPILGVVSGMTVSADGSRLALSYTTDYNRIGNGIYLYDLEAGGEPDVIVPEAETARYDELTFGPSGETLWVRRTDLEGQAVVELSVADGSVLSTILDGAEPASGGEWLAYLSVDAIGARRSVGLVDLATGERSEIEVLGGRYDLDHLLADPARRRVLVAALLPEGESGIRLGEPAGAHGAHDGPAQWLAVDVDTGEVTRLLEHEPLTIWDASLRADGSVVFTTKDGLMVAGETLEPLVEDRLLTVLAR